MRLDDIPGWFSVTDQHAFQWILEYQNFLGLSGDLLELGVFKGKSAIYIGGYLKPGEKFTVCDLFEEVNSSHEIDFQAAKFYKNLTQEEFEKNYLSFHSMLPSIIKGPSSSINNYLERNSCRFVHIDASHVYEHVREDISNSKSILCENGVVAFDDYRTEHTPGTAAAVWEAILNDELNPIFHTSGKLYCTWGDPLSLQAEIIRRAAQTSSYVTSDPLFIRKKPIIRMYWIKSKSR